jgi:uncharacterized protein YndB with AHSA1/START domain
MPAFVVPLQNCLHYCISEIKVQLILKCKQSAAPKMAKRERNRGALEGVPRSIIEEEMTMTKASVEHASFTIERVFKASPAQVFQAFADPAAHDRWFVKADNWPVAEYSHDFRVGGRESGRFSQDGETFYFNETVYLDIVENQRIVSAYTMAKGDRRISASIATVDLIAEGIGTRVVFTEQAAFLDGLDKVEYRREGWEQLIGFLAAELGENAAA